MSFMNFLTAASGGGDGMLVNLQPRVFFYFFLFFFIFFHFLVSSAHAQESVDFRSMHPKCVSVVGVFLRGQFAQDVKSSYYTKKPF